MLLSPILVKCARGKEPSPETEDRRRVLHSTRPGPGVATGVKPGAGIQTRESQFDDTPARESMVELDSELAARIEAAWRARSSQPNGAECPHTDEGWDRNFRGRDGDVLATRGYYPRVSGETAATLASAGIQLEAGVLGYGKRCTTKPARILRDGSSVAVKIYHDVHRPVADHPHEEGAPSREIEARHEEIAEYAREMNIQAGRDMHHPNLLRILAWSARPRDWLCCERFDCTLWTHVRSTQPWRTRASQFFRILAPITCAVKFLHSKGNVHKDINSHHVLIRLGADGDYAAAVLSGHKMCKTVSSERHGASGVGGNMTRSSTQSSSRRGNISWMDPACLDKPYTQSCDVYSLAVILGELLTGEEPYNGEPVGAVVLKKMSGILPFHLTSETRTAWPKTCELYDHVTHRRSDGTPNGCVDGLRRLTAGEFSAALRHAVRADAPSGSWGDNLDVDDEIDEHERRCVVQ